MFLAPSTFLILTTLAVAYLTVLTLIGVHARSHNTARAWRSQRDRFTFSLSLPVTLVLFGFSASHTTHLLPSTISGIFGTAMIIGTWAMAAWNDPGPVPEYHRAAQDRLRREWPALTEALDKATHTTRL